jgi:DNA mismatch endonuclease (patch repair protein)
VVLAKLLRAHGFTGWRRHTSLFGKPDFTFRRERVVVFVDGCFWHGCPKHSNMPVNNRIFWQRKLSNNKARDRLVSRMLRKDGWRVVRIWEHDLAKRRAACVKKIEIALTMARANLERKSKRKIKMSVELVLC